MKTERRFLLAPSLARLLRRERGSCERIAEGYLPSRPGRIHLVRIEAAQCRLVLISTGSEAAAEAQIETELPRSQAEALMQVCAGTVAFDRTRVQPGNGGEVSLDRLVAPGALDLLTVAFDGPSAAEGFSAPAWFGREVSDEPAFERHSIAVHGLPRAEEAPLSNAMLDAFLDDSESRSGTGHPRLGADQAISRPISTSRSGPAAPSAAGRPFIDRGPGETATPSATAAQARSAPGDRLNGAAADLPRAPSAAGEVAPQERPPAFASQRLGWRPKQSEQKA